MKYSEFKRDVEAMGFKIGICGGYIDVLNEHEEPLLNVGTEYDFSICTDYRGFDELDKDNKKELFYIAVELASTPLDEREDDDILDYFDDILDYFDDTALCGACGHYYCTCCGCDCLFEDYEEEDEDDE